MTTWRAVWQNRWLQAAANLLVSGVALALALRQVDAGEIAAALRQANWAWLGLAVLSVTVGLLAKAARWRALLRPAGRPVSFWQLLLSLLAGQMLNLVFPTRLGDVSRVVVVGRSGVGQAFTLGTLLLEKLLDTLCYIGLIGWVVLWMPLPDWLRAPAIAFVGFGLVWLAGALLLAHRGRWDGGLRQRILARAPAWAQRWLAPVRAGLHSLDALRDARLLAELSAWSVFTWASSVLNNYLVLLALGITPRGADLETARWLAAMLAMVGLQAGISIPSVPGRLGVFEYICVLVLGLFGVVGPLAASYGIVLHAVVMLPTLLAGFLAWLALGLNLRALQASQPVQAQP